MFPSIDKLLRESGMFKLQTHDRGRPRRVCMSWEEEILEVSISSSIAIGKAQREQPQLIMFLNP